MIKNYRSLRCQENSPYEHLRKLIENSMENGDSTFYEKGARTCTDLCRINQQVLLPLDAIPGHFL